MIYSSSILILSYIIFHHLGDDGRILSLDKIVIAASAVICAIVIIGALVIILFYFRRREVLQTPSSSLHHHATPVRAIPSLIKQQPPPETDWETLSWNSGRSTPKTNVHNCLVGKSGSTSHSFVLSDGQLQASHKSPRSIVNGFSKSYSTHDNESRLSYSHVSKVTITSLSYHTFYLSKIAFICPHYLYTPIVYISI